VATYLALPPLRVTAAADQSGKNPGNWTNAFTSAVLGGLHMPYVELYHATVTQAPAGASATIQDGAGNIWGFTAPGQGGGSEYHLGGSGWILTDSQEFYFFWDAAASGTPPRVCAFFRYDQDILANRQAGGIR
jgi:L-ascorbate metabolism protein UlaG (beta-lactamase superfamily)